MSENWDELRSVGTPGGGSSRLATTLRSKLFRACRYVGCLLTVVLLVGVPQALAERKEPPPEDLREVGVDEHLDQQLPLDLEFVDHTGKRVRLGDYFDGSLPVILTLNYSSCPMLCSLQLDGLFDGLKGLEDFSLGDKYRMVTVSIDPTEAPERAALTRQKYLKRYERAGAGTGYVCLTGKNKEIKRLADTVGYKYRYVPETGEYAHSAVTMICTPDGRMARYLYGVEYLPQSLKLGLLEASEGKIGTSMDQILLFCFQYDSDARKYAPAALRLMKLGALSIVVVVGGVLVVYWRRESKRSPAEVERTEETVESQ